MGLEDLPELGDTSGLCHYGDKPYYEFMNMDKPCYAEIAEITYHHYTAPQYKMREICYVFGKFDNLGVKGDKPIKSILKTSELWPSERCYFSWDNGGPTCIPVECIEEYKTIKKFKRKVVRKK